MAGNMQMMRQIQKMQAEMARIQEELGGKTVEATAGGGAVTVEINGHLELKSVRIDPAALDPQDVGLLEDLILAAVNEGLRKAQEMAGGAMAKFTGGLKIPGLF
ncbi:MAG: YbaB/EbfC family nucleoid-associated protein [Bacteroidota bacterium]